MHNVIVIPKWISTRIYKYDSEFYRAYISNEKTHAYIMLENLAAKLWKFIYEGENHERNKEELIDFAEKEEIYDELEIFTEELADLGFLLIDKEIDFKINNLNTVNSKDEKEVENFQEDMYIWLRNHNFIHRVFIELTYNCNLKCIHCFNPKEETNKQISFEDIKPFIDECYELGLFSVTLSGGECTIAKDFLKIAKYIREKSIQLDFYTNGQILYDNEKLFEEIVNLYPYKVSLSLYSMDENIHDSITGVNGSWKKTICVIKKLIARNIHVSIKCFLTKLNADNYYEVVKFAKESGATIELDCKLIDKPENCKSEIRATNNQLLKIYSDKNSPLKVRKENYDIDEEFLSRRICRGGLFDIAVDPFFNINVCATMNDLVLGNIKSDSIKKIWNDKSSKSKFVRFKSLRKKNLKECYKEEYCKYCIYCPGMALMNRKYLHKLEQFCNDAQIRMKAAKKG